MSISTFADTGTWLPYLKNWLLTHEQELHRYPEEEYVQLLLSAMTKLNAPEGHLALARTTLEALDYLSELFMSDQTQVYASVNRYQASIERLVKRHAGHLVSNEQQQKNINLSICEFQPCRADQPADISVILNPITPTWESNEIYIFEIPVGFNPVPAALVYFSQQVWADAYQKTIEPFHIPTPLLALMQQALITQVLPTVDRRPLENPQAEQRIQPNIRGIQPYIGGKGVKAMARELGKPIDFFVKLASNEHPNGLPPGFSQLLAEAIERSVTQTYEQLLADVQSALAVRLSVQQNQILIGTGSVDIIKGAVNALIQPGECMLSPDVPFAIYPFEAVKRQACYRKLLLTPDYQVDIPGFCQAIQEQGKGVVVLENPRNPLGTGLDDITEIIEALSNEQVLLLDEAYDAFIRYERPDFIDGKSWLERYPNKQILVQRTFSKSFGLASFRVGFAFGRPDLIQRIETAFLPGHVDAISLVAAKTILSHPNLTSWQMATVEQNAQEKQRFYSFLQALNLRYITSFANFVYFETGYLGDSKTLFTELAYEYGVITRPVMPNSLRVSIGNPHDNDRFLAALQQIAKGKLNS